MVCISKLIDFKNTREIIKKSLILKKKSKLPNSSRHPFPEAVAGLGLSQTAKGITKKAASPSYNSNVFLLMQL